MSEIEKIKENKNRAEALSGLDYLSFNALLGSSLLLAKSKRALGDFGLELQTPTQKPALNMPVASEEVVLTEDEQDKADQIERSVN